MRRLLIPRVRVRGLLPAYSERSGVGLKYYFNDFLGKGSRVTINAKYGFIDNRQKHYLRFQDIALGKGIVSTLLFQYRYLTHESFFGIGPDTDQNAESTFRWRKPRQKPPLLTDSTKMLPSEPIINLNKTMFLQDMKNRSRF